MSTIGRYRDPTGGNTLVATSTFTYDDNGRLDLLTHTKTGGTLETYDWGYDMRNRITSFDSSHNDEDAAYTYDETDQLIGATRATGTSESYAYDLNGNRTNTATASYQTGKHNQVISDGPYEDGYDDEG